MERLDKFLASQSVGSRKEVTALIRQGAVTVNGAVVKNSAQKLNPDTDTVCVAGKPVSYQKYLYIMMNKPAGVLSATEDRRQQTVLDLLPPQLSRRGLFPAGRLDKDTTGLLILTDDGDFAHRMLAPKNHVYKLYEATLARAVTEEDVIAFRNGIPYGENTFAPGNLTGVGETTARVEIYEGKFHQVKRMFRGVGNEVLTLKRLKIGELWLDDTLPLGEARLLCQEEIDKIFLGKMNENES